MLYFMPNGKKSGNKRMMNVIYNFLKIKENGSVSILFPDPIISVGMMKEAIAY